MIKLVETTIDPQEAIDAVTSPRAGAVVTFDGCVRDHSQGKEVEYLIYETYAEMAVKELAAVRSRVLEEFPVEKIAVIHRVGRMEIGESSVFIAVSSAHRADAFAACRAVIDRIKETVPIWKKEYFTDGAAWVEGDPSK